MKIERRGKSSEAMALDKTTPRDVAEWVLRRLEAAQGNNRVIEEVERICQVIRRECGIKD